MLIRDIINEVNRELFLRKQVFPRLIVQGRLTEGEAFERCDRLQASLVVLTWLLKHGVQTHADLANRTILTTGLNTESSVPSTSISIKGGGQ